MARNWPNALAPVTRKRLTLRDDRAAPAVVVGSHRLRRPDRELACRFRQLGNRRLCLMTTTINELVVITCDSYSCRYTLGARQQDVATRLLHCHGYTDDTAASIGTEGGIEIEIEAVDARAVC